MNSLTQINNQVQNLDLEIIEVLHCGDTNVALSPHSKAVYYGIGRQFNDYLVKKNMGLSPIAIKKFLESQPWQATTRNLKRNALMKIVINQPAVNGNPVLISAIKEAIRQEVPRVKIDESVRKGDYLTEDDLNDLISKVLDQRLAFIMEFLWMTGCRVSEMTGIRLGDINLQDGIANIRITGKGNKQRVVFIKEVIFKEVKNEFQSINYLFDNKVHKRMDRSNLWRDMKQAGIEAGFEFIHPHIFRHSTAMYLKAQGKTADYIQQYLGHKKLETTIDYYFHHKVDRDIVELF